MPCTHRRRAEQITHQIGASRRYVIMLSVNRYMVYGFLSDIQFLKAKNPQTPVFTGFLKAPRVGLEPTTTRLTAECSTIELSRIIQFFPQFLRCADTPVALPLSYQGLLSA